MRKVKIPFEYFLYMGQTLDINYFFPTPFFTTLVLISCFRLSGVQKLSRRKKATTAFCIGLHLGLVVVLDSDDFVSFSFAFFTSVVFSH